MGTVDQLAKILRIVSAHGLGNHKLDYYYGMVVVAGIDVTEDSVLGKKLLKAGVYLHDRVGWCIPI